MRSHNLFANLIVISDRNSSYIHTCTCTLYLISCSPGKLYGDKEFIEERHRHRYEVNPEYVEELEAKGLKFVGKSTDKKRMEILELEGQTKRCTTGEMHFITHTHTLSLSHTHTHIHTHTLSLSSLPPSLQATPISLVYSSIPST